jgi:hypothetical protein
MLRQRAVVTLLQGAGHDENFLRQNILWPDQCGIRLQLNQVNPDAPTMPQHMAAHADRHWRIGSGLTPQGQKVPMRQGALTGAVHQLGRNQRTALRTRALNRQLGSNFPRQSQQFVLAPIGFGIRWLVL